MLVITLEVDATIGDEANAWQSLESHVELVLNQCSAECGRQLAGLRGGEWVQCDQGDYGVCGEGIRDEWLSASM